MCRYHAAEEEEEEDVDGAMTKAAVAEGRAIKPSRKKASAFFAAGMGRGWKPQKNFRDF
jgi:hypothetical protein